MKVICNSKKPSTVTVAIRASGIVEFIVNLPKEAAEYAWDSLRASTHTTAQLDFRFSEIDNSRAYVVVAIVSENEEEAKLLKGVMSHYIKDRQWHGMFIPEELLASKDSKHFIATSTEGS